MLNNVKQNTNKQYFSFKKTNACIDKRKNELNKKKKT